MSTGNISEKARNQYFEYVEQRFEREPPKYKDALRQNGIKPEFIRSLKIEGKFHILNYEWFIMILIFKDPDDSSDNSTLKLSDEESDGETYVWTKNKEYFCAWF